MIHESPFSKEKMKKPSVAGGRLFYNKGRKRG
jgi:hypothetical protein